MSNFLLLSKDEVSGNKLFEIISLLGIANSLQRRPVIDATIPSNIRSLHKSIQPLFPKLVEQFDLKMIPVSKVVMVGSFQCRRTDVMLA